MSRNEFVDFFDQFAKEGGKIQSGGYRTAPKLVENINLRFDEFKAKMLEPFSPSFNLDSWLQWSGVFDFFGKGLATIYLNRINKHKYVVVNNKSIDGLKKLGYKIPSGNLKSQYDAILRSEKSLLEKYPELENFFRIDALMHYLIGTVEGGEMFIKLLSTEYFDLGGLRKYSEDFGASYDGNSPAVAWYYDTRKKLEYLVSLLGEKLKRNFVVNYKERPNNQAAKLKTYVLTGFSPEGVYPDGKLFIKLSYHLLDKSPVFDIEIDINSKIDVNPFKKDHIERTEKTRKSIPVDENFPDNWNDLLDKISGHVEVLTQKYQKIIQMKEPPEPGFEKSGSLNKILYGPPGTGKTYHSINYAISVVENKPVEQICAEERSLVKEKFANYIEQGYIAFCTFHQSLGYEDFIEGIKPVEPSSDKEQLSYAVEDGIFKRMCVNASFEFMVENSNPEGNSVRQTEETEIKQNVPVKFEKEYSYEDKKTIIDALRNEDFKLRDAKQYVLIIDEINRGNVSQVFGEIITLMEDDKRLGADEALKAILPYSKEHFGVPCNLHIIGTMNTADRSVEALDTALRRRFSFMNMEPEPEKLNITEDGINLKEMLRVINNRLSILKDSDHTIGHAWLWNVKNIDDLKNVFNEKILPLLKEFFYNDYEKLGLVLGDAFFLPHIQINSSVLANFSGGNGLAMQYDQSWQFSLKPVEDLTISDFQTLTPKHKLALPDEEQ